MKINWKAVPEAFKVLSKLGEKHLPTILTGIGVAGFYGTAIMAAEEAPRAESAIKKAQRDLACPEANFSDDEQYCEVRTLTKWEKVKIAAGYYWPSIALGAASTACVLGAHKIDLTRLASVTAAYQLSKKDLKELKDKIIEKDGDEKLKEYEKDIHEPAVQRIRSDYGAGGIYDTGKGTTIFFDPTIGMPFYCDLWKVEKAIDHMVSVCKTDDEYPLSAFRHELGLPRNDHEGSYHFYYEFVRDTLSHVEERDYSDYFEYHSVNSEEGDNRACIWINISEFISNRYSSDVETPFRYR